LASPGRRSLGAFSVSRCRVLFPARFVAGAVVAGGWLSSSVPSSSSVVAAVGLAVARSVWLAALGPCRIRCLCKTRRRRPNEVSLSSAGGEEGETTTNHHHQRRQTEPPPQFNVLPLRAVDTPQPSRTPASTRRASLTAVTPGASLVSVRTRSRFATSNARHETNASRTSNVPRPLRSGAVTMQ